jgi:DNA-binding NarL/FixJ family response regulator
MRDVLRQPADPGSGLNDAEDMKAFDPLSDAVRVGLMTDCARVEQWLRRVLRGEPSVELVELVGHAPPPAVLVLQCGTYSPQERLRIQRIVRRYEPARVLWLVPRQPVADDTSHTVLDAVKFGWCHGYITPDLPRDAVVRAIKAVADHDLWLSRRLLARALADSLSLRSVLGPPPAAHASGRRRCVLTARERQIVHLVRAGLANKEVGRHLGIEEDTVKKHLRNMYAKLGVRRRAQMLRMFTCEARAPAA